MKKTNANSRKKIEGLIDFNSFPKWGTPEHTAKEIAFHKEVGPLAPCMPILTDAQFYALQDRAAKYRHASAC